MTDKLTAEPIGHCGNRLSISGECVIGCGGFGGCRQGHERPLPPRNYNPLTGEPYPDAADKVRAGNPEPEVDAGAREAAYAATKGLGVDWQSFTRDEARRKVDAIIDAYISHLPASSAGARVRDLELREAIAKAIYELDPYYESGEYVDHMAVSPGGNLSWEQALARDAEFANVEYMLPVTKFAFDAADAVLALLPSGEADALRGELERVKAERDALREALRSAEGVRDVAAKAIVTMMARAREQGAALAAMEAICAHQSNRSLPPSDIEWNGERMFGTRTPVHPLTCGNDSNHTPLFPHWDGKAVVLRCPDCEYIQTRLPGLAARSFVEHTGERKTTTGDRHA